MTTQVETNAPAAVFARRAGGEECVPDPEPLGAALVAALEQALLAAHHLLGALDGAAGRHASAAAHRAQARQLLALIDSCGEMRLPEYAHTSDPANISHAQCSGCGAPAGLTRREGEVLGLLASGQSNRRIARALCLSPRTVQRHVANLYPKVGAHNRAEATAYALRHHLA